MNDASHAQTLGFQTEAKRLLHLMIHAMYSNRDIFLREFDRAWERSFLLAVSGT